MASGSWGAQCLLKLREKKNLLPEMVITAHPKPSGRGLKLKPNEVEEAAASLECFIRRSDNINLDEELKKELQVRKPDVILVIDFGQKVKEPYLSTPKFGCINLHPSLLPKYRGAAPIQRAIMDGQEMTGVTVFKLTEQMDAGPIIAQREVLIDLDDTAYTLGMKLLSEGVNLLTEALHYIVSGTAQLKEQDESKATYAPKITNEESYFNFNHEAINVHNKVRALNPRPGAHTFIRGKRLKVWRTSLINREDVLGLPGTILNIKEDHPVVACIKGAISLREVQWEGKPPIDGRSFLNGLRLREGDVLS